uniref:Growth hormone-inducible transmembrane protein n=1 Tax=Strigamia maritima TaxID=126957 RepID=T1JL56_STRMM
MMAARLAVCQFTRSSNLLRVKPTTWGEIRVSKLASQPKTAFRRKPNMKEGFDTRSKSLKEILMEPAGETAFVIGKGALAGASAFGLGALCYYGIGLSNELGAIDKAVMWPQYVRQRIRTTYLYFGASLGITAASAMATSKSVTIMRFMTRNSLMSTMGILAALVATGMVLHSIPYTDTFGTKQIVWIAHSSLIGTIIAPLCFLGGPLMMRAAWYTAGVVGGLSLLAACAPSEKFLHVGGPLAMGLGVIFVSSIGTFFFPASTALGAGLYSMSIYGGLVVFGGFLLYDTQRIIKMAEWSPEWSPAYSGQSYDPINASTSIYMDTINIFIRIVHILAGGGNGRR